MRKRCLKLKLGTHSSFKSNMAVGDAVFHILKPMCYSWRPLFFTYIMLIFSSMSAVSSPVSGFIVPHFLRRSFCILALPRTYNI